MAISRSSEKKRILPILPFLFIEKNSVVCPVDTSNLPLVLGIFSVFFLNAVYTKQCQHEKKEQKATKRSFPE